MNPDLPATKPMPPYSILMMGLLLVIRLLPTGPESMSELTFLRHEATFLKSRKGQVSRQGNEEHCSLHLMLVTF